VSQYLLSECRASALADAEGKDNLYMQQEGTELVRELRMVHKPTLRWSQIAAGDGISQVEFGRYENRRDGKVVGNKRRGNALNGGVS
jgi:hypothetical protein